jgi:hypothetical protein
VKKGMHRVPSRATLIDQDTGNVYQVMSGLCPVSVVTDKRLHFKPMFISWKMNTRIVFGKMRGLTAENPPKTYM